MIISILHGLLRLVMSFAFTIITDICLDGLLEVLRCLFIYLFIAYQTKLYNDSYIYPSIHVSSSLIMFKRLVN